MSTLFFRFGQKTECGCSLPHAVFCSCWPPDSQIYKTPAYPPSYRFGQIYKSSAQTLSLHCVRDSSTRQFHFTLLMKLQSHCLNLHLLLTPYSLFLTLYPVFPASLFRLLSPDLLHKKSLLSEYLRISHHPEFVLSRRIKLKTI